MFISMNCNEAWNSSRIYVYMDKKEIGRGGFRKKKGGWLTPFSTFPHPSVTVLRHRSGGRGRSTSTFPIKKGREVREEDIYI